MKALTRKQAEEFFKLVRRTEQSGFDNADRVIARIELKTFVEKHGDAACRAVFDAAMKKQKAKKK